MDSSISRYGALVIPLGALLLVELISPKHLMKEPEPTKANQSP
jgi:hypothetical protein